MDAQPNPEEHAGPHRDLTDRERAEALYGSAFYYGDLTQEDWVDLLVIQFALVRESAAREASIQSRVLPGLPPTAA